MRIMTLTSGLAVLTLAACGQGDGDGPTGKAPPAAATSAADLPAGMEPPAVETCIREAKFEIPRGAPESSGMACEQQSFRREGDAMVGHMACTSADGVRTITDTRVSGDFTRNYTMELKSTVTPPPSPDMAEVTMVMTAERLGDCPADSTAQ